MKLCKFQVKNGIKTFTIQLKTLLIEASGFFRKNELTIQIFLERGDNPHHLFNFNLEKWPNSGRNLIWLVFLDKWFINEPFD